MCRAMLLTLLLSVTCHAAERPNIVFILADDVGREVLGCYGGESYKTPNLDRPLKEGTEVNMHLPALIPGDYPPDVHMRLVLYKRIAAAATDDDLRELQVEMIDRFGLLPEPVGNLFNLGRLRIRAERLGISGIELGPQGGSIDFKEQTGVNPMSLVKLVQSGPRSYSLQGGNRLRLERDLEDATVRYQYIEDLLEQFAADATENAA